VISIENSKYLGRMDNEGDNKFIDLKIKRLSVFENKKLCEIFRIGENVLF
jgi:hypothetical protein